MSSVKLLIGFLSAICVFGQSTGVAVPEVRGPVPETPQSSAHMRQAVDRQGYVAEEYFVSGKADIYEAVAMADAKDMNQRSSEKDMARHDDYGRPVLKAGVPYTTRLLVYKPRDPSKFSGNVVVETFHPTGGGTPLVWRNMNHFFMANGDAYIGVQHPATFAGLKKFNPARYESLDMQDYTQLWGALAQTGALVKLGGPKSPLAGYRVENVFMTGISYTGIAVSVFANYHHEASKLVNGKPVYDGYLSIANGMYNRPIDVPVIRVMTQSDFNQMGALNNRRPDSDAQGSRFRMYEIAGAPHSNAQRMFEGMAERPQNMPVIATAEGASPNEITSNCQSQFPPGSTPNQFPNAVIYSAAMQNLYDWVRRGIAPPPGSRIETNPDGTTKLDEHGNAVGGLRTPYVDVPVATLGIGRGGCMLQGYEMAFDTMRLKSLYGNRENYIQKVEQAIKPLLDQRLILPWGAKAMLDDAKAIGNF